MKRLLLVLILAAAGLAFYLRRPGTDMLTVMREGQTP